jgi:hypothetical protein
LSLYSFFIRLRHGIDGRAGDTAAPSSHKATLAVISELHRQLLLRPERLVRNCSYDSERSPSLSLWALGHGAKRALSKREKRLALGALEERSLPGRR